MLKPSQKRTVLHYCIMVGSSVFCSPVGFGSLCRVISCTVASRCVVASQLVSCLVRHLASCHDLSSCDMYHVIWYDVWFKVSASWQVMSCCAASCRVMSSLLVSRLVRLLASCQVLSSRVFYMASHKQARFADMSDRKLGSGSVLHTYVYFDLLRHGSRRHSPKVV